MRPCLVKRSVQEEEGRRIRVSVQSLCEQPERLAVCSEASFCWEAFWRRIKEETPCIRTTVADAVSAPCQKKTQREEKRKEKKTEKLNHFIVYSAFRASGSYGGYSYIIIQQQNGSGEGYVCALVSEHARK